MSGAHLTVQNLTTGYHGFQVLQDLSLQAAPGITVIVGPNGAGKTTLLKALAGLLPRQGSVTLDGQAVPPTGLGQGVARVDLDIGVVFVDPQRHLMTVGGREPGPGPAGDVTGQVGVGVVDLLLTQAPALPEVEIGSFDRLAAGRDLTFGVGEEARSSIELEGAVVDETFTR